MKHDHAKDGASGATLRKLRSKSMHVDSIPRHMNLRYTRFTLNSQGVSGYAFVVDWRWRGRSHVVYHLQIYGLIA